MFTGIIERTIRVAAIAEGPRFRRLTIPCEWNDVRQGQSIALNGVCLTVADLSNRSIGFDVISETLSRTNLGLLNVGDELHVERALRVGDRLDGHFVLGHVDGPARIVEQRAGDDEWRTVLEVSGDLGRFLAPKGSVCLDGVSLTIANVKQNVFEVALIPTTLKLTTIGKKPAGWLCNFEADILTKSVVNWLERNDRRADHE